LVSHVANCVKDRHLALFVELLHQRVQSDERSSSSHSSRAVNQKRTALHRVLGVDRLDELQDAVGMFGRLEILPHQVVVLGDVTRWLFCDLRVVVGVALDELRRELLNQPKLN
jgi:hypothetical protein